MGEGSDGTTCALLKFSNLQASTLDVRTCNSHRTSQTKAGIPIARTLMLASHLPPGAAEARNIQQWDFADCKGGMARGQSHFPCTRRHSDQPA